MVSNAPQGPDIAPSSQWRERYALLIIDSLNLAPGQSLFVKVLPGLDDRLVDLVITIAQDLGHPVFTFNSSVLPVANQEISEEAFAIQYRTWCEDLLARGAGFVNLAAGDEPLVSPELRSSVKRAVAKEVVFFGQALLGFQIHWCIANLPNVAAARLVYPELDETRSLLALQRTFEDVLLPPEASEYWKEMDRILVARARKLTSSRITKFTIVALVLI